MHMPPPVWLSEFEQQMSQYLCQPLDAGSGTLLPTEPSMALLGRLKGSCLSGRDAGAGLRTYNRQYWLRLMSIMQGELPLTAALMGLWSFNLIVQDYLASAPPQHYDIQKIAASFFAFLSGHRHQVPSRLRIATPYQALLQAVLCDQAFQQVFLAPAYRPLEMSLNIAAQLADLNLVAAESWQIISEDWKLLALRSQLSKRKGEQPLKMPDPWEASRSWLIIRSGQMVGQILLDPLQAQLYKLLKLKTVGAALKELEQSCPAAMLNVLPKQIQAWMSLSMELELWTYMES